MVRGMGLCSMYTQVSTFDCRQMGLPGYSFYVSGIVILRWMISCTLFHSISLPIPDLRLFLENIMEPKGALSGVVSSRHVRDFSTRRVDYSSFLVPSFSQRPIESRNNPPSLLSWVHCSKTQNETSTWIVSVFRLQLTSLLLLFYGQNRPFPNTLYNYICRSSA